MVSKLITIWVSDNGVSYKKLCETVVDLSFYSADIKISITNNSDSHD